MPSDGASGTQQVEATVLPASLTYSSTLKKGAVRTYQTNLGHISQRRVLWCQCIRTCNTHCLNAVSTNSNYLRFLHISVALCFFVSTAGKNLLIKNLKYEINANI